MNRTFHFYFLGNCFKVILFIVIFFTYHIIGVSEDNVTFNDLEATKFKSVEGTSNMGITPIIKVVFHYNDWNFKLNFTGTINSNSSLIFMKVPSITSSIIEVYAGTNLIDLKELYYENKNRIIRKGFVPYPVDFPTRTNLLSVIKNISSYEKSRLYVRRMGQSEVSGSILFGLNRDLSVPLTNDYTIIITPLLYKYNYTLGKDPALNLLRFQPIKLWVPRPKNK